MLIQFISCFLYMPVMRRLLTALACTFEETDEYLVADPNIQCFVGIHFFYVLFSFVAISMYYLISGLTTPFLQLYDPMLQIWQSQDFAFTVFQMRTMLVVLDVFFHKSVTTMLMSLTVVNAIIAWWIFYAQPFNVKEINEVVSCAFLYSVITSVCSLAAHMHGDDSRAAIAFYAISLCLILLLQEKRDHHKTIEYLKHAERKRGGHAA